ncbi:MAG: acyltransferase [Clostridium sartagoforme]|nr:acyltransferase [Clostridium sartagoforme]
MENKKYFNETNYMKGVAILLVFIGHAATPSFLIRPYGYEFVVQFIYLIHMPVFFFVSGFLSVKILTMDLKNSYYKFIKSKFLRLGVPFLTLSFITNFLIISLKALTNSNLSIKDILEMIKVVLFYPETSVMGALWFLYTLLIIFVISPLLVKSPMKILLLATIILNIFSPRYVHFLAFGRISFFLIFYLFGLIVRKNYDKFKSIINKNNIVISLIAFITIFINAYIYSKEITLNTYLLNILSFISGILGILIIYILINTIKSSKINKALNILGKYSLDIYIFSWFFQIISMILITKILKIQNYHIFFISNMLVGSLCLPFSIYFIRKIKIFRVLLLGIN